MTKPDSFRQPLIDLFHRSEEGKRHVRFFSAIPEPLVPYLPGFWWNQSRLFTLPLIETSLPVTELDHCLALPIWRATSQSKLFSVTGSEILASPEQYEDHWKRVQMADSSYPVTLYRRDNRTLLLDGYHRLLKTMHLGRSSIAANFLSPGDLPGVLEHEGFLGELNAVSRCDPEFIASARCIALELLDGCNPEEYPLWV